MDASQIDNKKSNILLIRNVVGNYLVKGGSLLVILLLTPAYMAYFNNQTLLGLWFTAVAVLNWLMLFDFGIGGGIRNQIVAPLMRGDKKEIREILSAGYVAIGIVVIVLLVIQHFIVDWINWFAVFNVSSMTISEKTLKTMVHILLIGIIIRFFTVLVSHVFYAMQKATVPGFLILLSNVLILIYIKLSKPSGQESDIIRLAVVQALATNVPTLVATGLLFLGDLRGTFPKINVVKISRVKAILGTGGSLFYLQILITIVFGVKELLITWFVGTAQVVDYNIYLKLIGVVSTLFSLALTPVWSAVTKEYSQKNYSRIKNLYKTGMAVMALFALSQLLLVVCMPWLARLWLGDASIAVSRVYALIYSVYNVVYMWTMLNYNFACGMGRVKSISIWLTVAFVINILLASWWCSINPSWIIVIASTAVASIPCALFVPKSIFSFSSEQ